MAFIASDQHGWVKFGYTGSQLRLDLPTADNGYADVEVVVNGTVVASISEVGNAGATQLLSPAAWRQLPISRRPRIDAIASSWPLTKPPVLDSSPRLPTFLKFYPLCPIRTLPS